MATMKRYDHLSLIGAVCRLAPSDAEGERAATQWQDIFGVPRSRDLVAFTNARVGFTAGQAGLHEGIISISIGVKGEQARDEIIKRAERMGLSCDFSRKSVDMLGLTWYFVHTGEAEVQSRL